MKTNGEYYNIHDDCHAVKVPSEIYRQLLETASELNFQHIGKVCVAPLIEALAQIEAEDVYEILRERGLLPKPKRDRLFA